jgi:hypothetical protein
MSEQPARSSSPRARPVAEPALQGLQEHTREIARQWAIALILDGPPESLGSVPLEDLARDAPALASGLLAALTSDAELERLLGGGRSAEGPASSIASMTGASDAAGVVNAVEALRGVLWEAVLGNLGMASQDPGRARTLADLSDRLAHVCAAILPQALAGAGHTLEPTLEMPGAAVPPAAVALAPGPARAVGVIVDERATPEPPAAKATLTDQLGEGVAEPSPSGEIQIRDERGEEGPAAWIRSIGRHLERFEEDGVSFAVLLVEVRDEAPLKQAQITFEPLEELLVDQLSTSGGGAMTRERAGRYWLLAPGTERIEAGVLAERITRALESRARRRPLSLTVAIGTAICPEDGRLAAALAAHADVGLFAARAERHLEAPTEAAQTPESD